MLESRLNGREEQAEKKVSEIRQKVAERQGEVVLSLREIKVKEGEGCFGSDRLVFHTEAGVICGKLEDRSGVEPRYLSDLKMIDISGGMLKAHEQDSYMWYPEFLIPAKQVLVNNNSMCMGISLRFSSEEIKRACSGKITFARDELVEMPDIPGYERRLPCLERLNILIGEGEIREFARSKRDSSVMEDHVEHFLNLLKTPGEIERIVAKYDFEEREEVADILVSEVARLAMLDNQISEIEEGVLGAKASRYTDDEGRSPHIKWIGGWGEGEEVDKYLNLRNEVDAQLQRVGELVARAEEVGLSQYPNIDGRRIGFPGEISPKDYLPYVRTNVIQKVNERVRKLDTHLRQEEERAR